MHVLHGVGSLSNEETKQKLRPTFLVDRPKDQSADGGDVVKVSRDVILNEEAHEEVVQKVTETDG